MNTYLIKKWTDNSIIAEIKEKDFNTAFEQAVKENIDFSYANLTGANLFHANLFHANLFHANLFHANLKWANLEGANLKWANLEDANLFHANLKWANLEGANLFHANLFHANLEDVNLFCANLTGANLKNANLEDANIDFSCWPLWCGSANVKGDERLAKQLLAHAFNLARKFWPGDLTQEQIDWLNDFHRIKSNEFPRFK